MAVILELHQEGEAEVVLTSPSTVIEIVNIVTESTVVVANDLTPSIVLEVTTGPRGPQGESGGGGGGGGDVTLTGTQTLTNKTLTAPVINNPTGLVKADVGLGNVNNTSDANKPVSDATQAALDDKYDSADATTDLAGKQPIDSDLTAIAGLSPSNDDVIQRKAGAWTNRTPAQLKTDLSLTKSDVGLSSVDNTSDAGKPVSTAQQTALDLKADSSTVTSHTGATAAHGATGAVVGTTNTQTLTNKTLTAPVVNSPTGIVKGDVGLGNVDNTADTAKPVSTAQQTALNLKANIASPTFTGTVAGITKTMVGLGNVDNVSDASKPISTLTQAALDLKQTLDSDLTAIAALSATNDDIIQRKSGAWTNRTMAQLKTDLVLVKGDVGLGNVDNTADTAKPISTLQQAGLDLKVSLAGTETITGIKNFTTPKTQSAMIITRGLGSGQDVTSTDEDIFKVLFGANAASPIRSFWLNEWGAMRIAVPSTHPAEAAIKIQPGTSAGGYVLFVGTSADINAYTYGLKNSGELTVGAIIGTSLTSSGAISGTTGTFSGAVSGTTGTFSGAVSGTTGTFTGNTTVSANFTPKRLLSTIFALTDASTIAVDASLGNIMRVTLGGNRTLGVPTNPSDGQVIMFEFKQDGTGTRTLTIPTGANQYKFGTDLTSVTLSTAINITDRLLVQYNLARDVWDVIGFKKGF